MQRQNPGASTVATVATVVIGGQNGNRPEARPKPF